MFRNSTEAFLSVVDERGTDWSQKRSIRQIHVETGYLRNGVKYCSVEIVCNDGAGFHISAYDNEASELHAVAKHLSIDLKMRENEIVKTSMPTM